MKKPIDIQFIKFPKVELIIGSFEDKLCLCDFKYRKARRTIDKRLQLGLSGRFIEQSNSLLDQTKNALEEYFSGDRDSFYLPLLTVGTTFQKSVWNSLLEIPYGETISYETLAVNIGNKNAIRAVGSANGANALAIIIPCHRVISASGSLGGYSGGLPLKQDLLNLEKRSQ
jgi:methylated-DNA-[protein]-cysteine S-methyltransferase